MTYPLTSADAEWPTTTGRWVRDVPATVTTLDLRPVSKTTTWLPTADQWADAARTDQANRVTESGLSIALHEVRGTTLGQDTIWALVLSTTGWSPDRDTSDAVAVLTVGHSRHTALLNLQEAGLVAEPHKPWHGEHLDQVWRTLSAPNSWLDGLGDADVRTRTEPGLALTELLQLAHPRVTTYAACRPYTILTQCMSANAVLAWLSSGLLAETIQTMASPLSHLPVEHAIRQVVDAPLPLVPRTLAAMWATHDLDLNPYPPKTVAALVYGGWQPPTARRAAHALSPRGPGGATMMAALERLARMPLPALHVVRALEAGLSVDEIADLPADGSGGTWDAVDLLSALH